nr:MAG TPA: hypothetical protein [Caudoviricetes sp.]
MNRNYSFKALLNIHRGELGLLAREFDDLYRFCKDKSKKKDALCILNNIFKWDFGNLSIDQMLVVFELTEKLCHEVYNSDARYAMEHEIFNEYTDRFGVKPVQFTVGIDTLAHLTLIRRFLMNKIELSDEDIKVLDNIKNIISHMRFGVKRDLNTFIDHLISKYKDESAILKLLICMLNHDELNRLREPEISITEMTLMVSIDIISYHDRDNIDKFVNSIHDCNVIEFVSGYNDTLVVNKDYLKLYRLLMILISYYNERANV